MINLILINGGPHKSGNTMCIAEWLAEDARTHGARVETIHPVDRHIEHCRGCDACGRTGRCIIKVDHAAICVQLDQATRAIVCSLIFGVS